MDNFAGLSKKERKKLKREVRKQGQEREKRNKTFQRSLLWVAGMGTITILGWWFVKTATAPKPGQKVADLGRQHVSEGTEVSYNSNPPTSGPHYEEWEKAGIYETPLDDRKLVHSLEHGYIIISYSCDGLTTNEVSNFAFTAYAHEEEPVEEATQSGRQESAGLVDWKENKACQELVSKLSELVKKNRLWKLILVPRLNLDTHIAMTAWTRIDKFDQFSEERIVAFIKAFRDKGPERTME